MSFVAGIFIGDWLYSLARAPTTVTLSQSFSNLVRSWLNTLSTKQCSAFLHFAFIIFYGAFSIQNAEVKDVNQNFMSNNLNKEKSEHPLAKKANLWTIDAVTDLFWIFYGKLELVKVKNVNLEVTVLVDSFNRKHKVFFGETFWCVNDNLLIRQWFVLIDNAN